MQNFPHRMQQMRREAGTRPLQPKYPGQPILPCPGLCGPVGPLLPKIIKGTLHTLCRVFFTLSLGFWVPTKDHAFVMAMILPHEKGVLSHESMRDFRKLGVQASSLKRKRIQ